MLLITLTQSSASVLRETVEHNHSRLCQGLVNYEYIFFPPGRIYVSTPLNVDDYLMTGGI